MMRPHTTSISLPSLPSSIISLSSLASILFSFSAPAAAFDCSEVLAQKVQFNFKELGGPHIVTWEEPPDLDHEHQYKYNFTVDICNKLQWHKGGSKETECPHGTRICALREEIDLTGQHNSTIQPIAIAGSYTTQTNRKIDAQFELLRNSKSNSDVGREGVRAALHGGRFPFDDKREGIDQQAIIEFVCDKERTGLEGGRKDDGAKEPDNEKSEGEKDGEKDGKSLYTRESDKCEKTDASLRFCGYKLENTDKDKKVKTLRLEWRTKHACENASNDRESSSHWGFFTWFIIILFLATAAYLIFGSWLNYNRYGARGWDLLPHGDTIRDIPYIAKDWARRVKDSVQGPGSRGGYSAV